MWSSVGKQREAAIGSVGKQVDAFVSAACQVLMPALGAVAEGVVPAGSDVEPSNGTGGINFPNTEYSSAEKKPQEIVLQYQLTGKTSGNENVSSSSVDKHEQSGVSEETKQDLAEWNVETVIKEQETHDIICPQCKSCITRTVILCKRKRHPAINHLKGKRTQPPGGYADPSAPGPMSVGPVLNENPREPERVAFRCGACFSFFIQTVAGFGIFKVFQPRSEGQSRPQIPAGTGDKGGDLILPIKPAQDGSGVPSHSMPRAPGPQLPPVGQTEPAVRSGGCDILKSIVNGGLVQTITSLGVVSSVAGGGAKTINIIALAMANLVTGLLITVNGVRQLTNEPVKEEQDDRYY